MYCYLQGMRYQSYISKLLPCHSVKHCGAYPWRKTFLWQHRGCCDHTSHCHEKVIYNHNWDILHLQSKTKLRKQTVGHRPSWPIFDTMTLSCITDICGITLFSSFLKIPSSCGNTAVSNGSLCAEDSLQVITQGLNPPKITGASVVS